MTIQIEAPLLDQSPIVDSSKNKSRFRGTGYQVHVLRTFTEKIPVVPRAEPDLVEQQRKKPNYLLTQWTLLSSAIDIKHKEAVNGHHRNGKNQRSLLGLKIQFVCFLSSSAGMQYHFTYGNMGSFVGAAVGPVLVLTRILSPTPCTCTSVTARGLKLNPAPQNGFLAPARLLWNNHMFANLASSVGIVPIRKLEDNATGSRTESAPSSVGIVPVSSFCTR